MRLTEAETSDLIERLRAATRYCDDKAAVVSNLKKHRTDNDYGRGGEPDPTLSHGQFLEMIRLAEDARLGAIARATAAESQLEMARKALERAAIIIKEDRNTTSHCGTVRGDPATMDAPTREAIADYDAVLAEIARALAEGETK